MRCEERPVNHSSTRDCLKRGFAGWHACSGVVRYLTVRLQMLEERSFVLIWWPIFSYFWFPRYCCESIGKMRRDVLWSTLCFSAVYVCMYVLIMTRMIRLVLRNAGPFFGRPSCEIYMICILATHAPPYNRHEHPSRNCLVFCPSVDCSPLGVAGWH